MVAIDDSKSQEQVAAAFVFFVFASVFASAFAVSQCVTVTVTVTVTDICSRSAASGTGVSRLRIHPYILYVLPSPKWVSI